VKRGVPISDQSAGRLLRFAITARPARERTGRKQRIDMSLFGGALALSIPGRESPGRRRRTAAS
jgi:crotonobetainyl-CoA:carnitine CoA-transferase CaiB-like acyl-CoA transferase